MLEVGERVSWPALRMVRNRLTIEVSSHSTAFPSSAESCSERSYEGVPRSARRCIVIVRPLTLVLLRVPLTVDLRAPVHMSRSSLTQTQASSVALGERVDLVRVCRRERSLANPRLKLDGEGVRHDPRSPIATSCLSR